jgi:hypothetical protein
VIGEPPSEGGENEIVTCALPGTALTPVGVPGTALGVTMLDGAEAGPVPAALVAVTVNV